MPLAPATRFGAYEVLAPLGAGGMGEVYRARDTKLGREVALKILPEAFASDPDRVMRFEREARTLAALNHPYIAQVHGLEDSGATRALVMELVAGEDLSTRIAREPIPVDEALPIARQIAEALEAAHEAGIIHRDLKPANIKIRDDGTVKVLDFGLAKALDAAPDALGNGATDGATITSPAMTMRGMILGTAAYMAPEQAKGRAVDKRADIWAFGCVLYEMLTGQRAFKGDDITDTIVAVVSREPDWTMLPAPTPSIIGRLLRACLRKNPHDRLSSMGAVLFALSEDERLHGMPVPPPSPSRSRTRLAVGLAVVLAAAAVLSGLAILRATPEPSQRAPIAFAIAPFRASADISTPLVGATTGPGTNLAISADGARVVFRSGQEGRAIVAARELSSAPPVELPATLGARSIFLSPDGGTLGFFVGGQLRRVSVHGGQALVICDVDSPPRGAVWLPDDTIVFATTHPDTGLMTVPASGGTPRALTRPDASKGEDHFYPVALPGDRGLLFVVQTPSVLSNSFDARLAVLDRQTGDYRKVIDAGSRAAYVNGHIVYVSVTGRNSANFVVAPTGTMFAVPFDAASLHVTGAPVALAPGSVDFAVSATGTLVSVSGGAGEDAVARRELVWVDRSGRESPTGAPQRPYHVARISPGGDRALLQIADQERDIWLWEFDRLAMTRATLLEGDEQSPTWLPDGRRFVMSSNTSGQPNLFRQSVDGTGSPEPLLTGPYAQMPLTVTADGRTLVYFQASGTGAELWSLPLDTPSPTPRALLTGGRAWGADLSPDGRWLAYHSNESGRDEVYVRPFPDVQAGRSLVSTQGGSRPAWARTGRELFYLDAADLLTSVRVDVIDGAPRFGAPTTLLKRAYFAGSTVLGLDLRGYDVAADGSRFLMIKDSAAAPMSTAAVDVVVGWGDRLRAGARSPTARP